MLFAACGGGEEEVARGVANTPATATSVETTEAVTATTVALPEITLPRQPPSDYEGFRAQETACGAEAPEPAAAMTFDAPEDQNLDPEALITATISTSCGDIVVELDPSLAPETVNSFVFLARSGYFDGTVSHRVYPEFVVQAGDPTATGIGGPGYTIPDELPERGFLYSAGVLAMANAGAGTTGSQFFIMLGDAPLPNDYSYFGNVVSGTETLQAIAAIPLGQSIRGEVSVPMETLYIETVTIAE